MFYITLAMSYSSPGCKLKLLTRYIIFDIRFYFLKSTMPQNMVGVFVVFYIGLGVFLYALPHFLVGPYQPTQSGPDRGFCSRNDSPFGNGQMKCNLENDSQWHYLAIFVLSQLITGAGISPFYSLLSAYLDENVHPKSLPVYLGVWTCARFLGPGLGFVVGGKLLSIYVDLKQV